jgi:serine phosphatase RsbU (regulator of sigma subunit)
MLYDETSQFATVALAYLALGTGGTIDVRLSLAGHPAPVVLRRDGQVEMAGRFGTMAGLRSDPQLHDIDLQLHGGDVLLLYTDGVIEAGPRRAPFGDEGLAAILKDLAGQSPQTIVDAVERAVVAAQPGDPRDDIALLALSMTATS